MRKNKELHQGNHFVFDIILSVVCLAGTLALLAGCGTGNNMRAELAAPPPSFDPSAAGMPELSVLMTRDLEDNFDIAAAAIEPAAGAAVSALPVSLADESCALRVGGAGGNALFYQWGENSFGLGMVEHHPDSDFGLAATLRYSISLHRDSAPSGSCVESELFSN